MGNGNGSGNGYDCGNDNGYGNDYGDSNCNDIGNGQNGTTAATSRGGSILDERSPARPPPSPLSGSWKVR